MMKRVIAFATFIGLCACSAEALLQTDSVEEHAEYKSVTMSLPPAVFDDCPETKNEAILGSSIQYVWSSTDTVGIFPESRLPVDGKPWPFKPSVVFIALRTDAPIVPMYTDGAYSLKKRTRVMIGEKIYLRDYCADENPSPEEIMRLTKILEDKTFALGEELKKRVEKENGKK